MKTYGGTEDGNRGLAGRYLRCKYTAVGFPLEVWKLEAIGKKNPRVNVQSDSFFFPGPPKVKCQK